MTSIVEGMAAAAALTAEHPVAVPAAAPIARRRLRPERSLPQAPNPISSSRLLASRSLSASNLPRDSSQRATISS